MTIIYVMDSDDCDAKKDKMLNSQIFSLVLSY